MLPYADSEDTYWTGFYSSRANNKDYIKTASNNIRAALKLYTLKAID